MRHMEPRTARVAFLTEPPPQGMAPLAVVLERDVDLLLVEELSCSDAFRVFFANAVLPGIDLVGASWVIRHSVNRPGLLPGETDIEVTIEGDALPGAIRLLIENKVDAGFQPEQVARYLHEARRVLETGDCWLARTCLVAPSAYLDSRSDAAAFDVSLAYETIAAHLSGRAAAAGGELAARLRFRATTIEHAVSKARRGYVPVPHSGITDFWFRYWQVATAEAPSLRMPQPAERGGRSSWIRFPKAIAPHPPLPRVFLVHKLEKGRVQLEFPGWAGRFELLEETLRMTGAPFETWPAQKSAAIAAPVPELDPADDFDDQLAAVRAGLAAAVRLQEWWNQHWRSVLEGAGPRAGH